MMRGCSDFLWAHCSDPFREHAHVCVRRREVPGGWAGGRLMPSWYIMFVFMGLKGVRGGTALSPADGGASCRVFLSFQRPSAAV